MRPHGRPRAQGGQALVFGLLWLVPLLVVLLAVYAGAQYTTAKIELQNAADASAYSVATIAARDYNFSAYMNRAMVANQVATAQFVGIASWITFTGRVITNLTYVCDFFPAVASFCNEVKTYYDKFKAMYVGKVWPKITAALSKWLTALSVLQQAYHVATIEALWRNLGLPEGSLRGVLWQNDPDAKAVRWSDARADVPSEIYQLALVIHDAYEWWTYTQRYKEGGKDEGMNRFAAVVNDSVDGFGRSRGWDTPTVSTSDWRRFLDVLPGWMRKIIESFLDCKLCIVWIEGNLDMSLHRRGATVLKNVTGQHSWAALDTMEEHTEVSIYGCWRYYPGGKKHCTRLIHATVPIPIGWGISVATQAGNKGREGGIVEAPDASYAGAKEDTWAAYLVAVKLKTDVSVTDEYEGLGAYYDVADGRRADGGKSASFTLLVSKAAGAITGLGGALYDGSASAAARSIGLPKAECAAQLYALARGRVRYARDATYSSLFTPFWEATLADPGDLVKLGALVTARGVSLQGGGCDARLLPW